MSDYPAIHDIDLDSARLPATYEAAKSALAKCSSIDECQKWANKAEALASYAKQAADESLRKMALRIHARAIRRCGELIKQVKPARGANQNIRTGAGTKVSKGSNGKAAETRASVAAAAGLSKRQKDTALQVANVPDKSFAGQVDSESPPTVTKLANQGRRPLVDLGGRDPKKYSRATEALGTLRSFAEFCRQNTAADVAEGTKPHEAATARKNVATIDAWLDQFVTRLPGDTQ